LAECCAESDDDDDDNDDDDEDKGQTDELDLPYMCFPAN
jgi:hypothetical protein